MLKNTNEHSTDFKKLVKRTESFIKSRQIYLDKLDK